MFIASQCMSEKAIMSGEEVLAEGLFQCFTLQNIIISGNQDQADSMQLLYSSSNSAQK